MSLRYLPEHAESALLALELARKEAADLRYTHRTLFAQPIDAAWVQQLTTRDDLAEKIDAFVSRFGRLQEVHVRYPAGPASAVVSPRGCGNAFSHGCSH